MPLTVDTNDNAGISNVGTDAGNATIISSGFTGTTSVQYQIGSQDGIMDTINVVSTNNVSTRPQVVAVSVTELQILLPERQALRVRVRQGSGAWSAWVNFTTRDKSYKSPDIFTKATIVDTAAGATVTNTDTGFNKTTITNTARGATVTNTN